MPLTITLESNEALVLFELLASKSLESHVKKPERNALWILESKLEKLLVEPFDPNYKHLLDVARKSLIEYYGD